VPGPSHTPTLKGAARIVNCPAKRNSKALLPVGGVRHEVAGGGEFPEIMSFKTRSLVNSPPGIIKHTLSVQLFLSSHGEDSHRMLKLYHYLFAKKIRLSCVGVMPK
jgi:hypothetical protein